MYTVPMGIYIRMLNLLLACKHLQHNAERIIICIHRIDVIISELPYIICLCIRMPTS